MEQVMRKPKMRRMRSVRKSADEAKLTKILTCLLLFCFLMIADCQTIDQIQQRSTLRAYDTNSKLLHDEFYIPIQEYSDPLHYDKDYTYFMSQVQPGEYEFKKFSHSTMSATTIMSKIMLSAYQVFDICHVGSRLDYVVGLHMETNEVRVITLKESSST